MLQTAGSCAACGQSCLDCESVSMGLQPDGAQLYDNHAQRPHVQVTEIHVNSAAMLQDAMVQKWQRGSSKASSLLCRRPESCSTTCCHMCLAWHGQRGLEHNVCSESRKD